jgi:Mrp family chromosome partitioning ATPase
MDLRRPTLHNKFDLEKENGTSDYLIDPEVAIDQLLNQPVFLIWMLLPVALSPNPSELIASPRTDALLEELKSRYDFVLVDSPPLIAVTDPYFNQKS